MGGLLSYIPAILYFGELSLRAIMAATILLRRNTDSTTRLAWLVVVLLIPFIGAVAYILFGEIRFGSYRMKRHREVVLRMSTATAREHVIPAASHTDIPENYEQIATLAEAVGASHPVPGNEVELLGESDTIFRRMIEDIGNAKHHCHIVTYIYLDDDVGRAVAAAMIEAEKRGVECRVLIDDVGSTDFLKSQTCQAMIRAGVQVTAALPANVLRALVHRIDIRNHRKIVVIDGEIGYTGSQNIAHPSFAPKAKFAPWIDMMARMRGPVVADLQRLFCEDWFLDTDEWLEHEANYVPQQVEGGVIAQAIGTGPNSGMAAMRQLNHAAIYLAREEIVLTTPYFVPDEPTTNALRTAARSGVETHLIVPQRNDSLLVALASYSYFDDLLDAGVHIHEYKSGLLHAKTMCLDHTIGLISSANFDKRSFFINFEQTVLIYDSNVASQLRYLQQTYMTNSEEVDLQRWGRRRWPRRLAHNAAGMLGPLL